MKPALLLVCLLIQSLTFGQIVFEEVVPPNDFSIGSIRRSPIGEYFMQATNDKNSIYTSMNGLDWTRAILPLQHTMDDMQFFNDGTPVLQNESTEHLIRRNGSWYSMDAGNGGEDVKASFIKDDTLFIYQDRLFAYSLNKGQSFTAVFTYSGTLIDDKAHLWKFNNHFVLYHTGVESDSLSIFTTEGTRIAKYRLNLGSSKITYNSCGEVLFTDYDRFYRLREQGLVFTSGPVTQVIPQEFSISAFQSANGNYYIRSEDTLYSTQGCNYNWEPLLTHGLIDSADQIWVGAGEYILIVKWNDDAFFEESGGENIWEEFVPDVDYAFVSQIDESANNYQATLTHNGLFNKLTADPAWTEHGADDYSGFFFQIQYSPRGDLYVNRRSDIQYSQDNGHSFTTIEVPSPLSFGGDYRMKVLDDDVLFIYDLFDFCYYTVNNGLDWTPVNIFFLHEPPLIKLVDHYILVAFLDYQLMVNQINIATGEHTVYEGGDFYSLAFDGYAIQDDGTIYFQGFDINNPVQDGLFRYRVGASPEYIGRFAELQYSTLIASGNDLFSFEDNEYHVLSGNTIRTYEFVGLPSGGNKQFFHSENEHLYVTIDNHRIFRSTEPLSYQKYISGSVYHDRNDGCALDTLDPTLQYWQVKIENDVYLRVKNTDSEGHFSFDVPFGTYTLSTKPVSDNWEVCEPAYQVAIDENNTAVERNFIASALQHCANLEIDFSTPLLRRCFENYYSIYVRNTGPEASHGTILRLELDPYYEFISATLPQTPVSDHVFEFDLGVLEVNDEVLFQVYFKISCDVELGAEHCLTGTLLDQNLCGNSRNTYTECQENIGSYDPNDKRVFNGSGKEVERIDKGEYIYYHIRFQNTGTDTAFTVRINDPLSPTLDYSTLEMLSASHPYSYLLTDGPSLSILFENILLPDSSTNEPASHGFVKFRIKPLAQFDYGTNIPNTAGIYFDYNNPVLTNEAILVIHPLVRTIDADALIEFNVFPNPANTSIQITLSSNDRSRIDSYEIIDLLGHQMRTGTLDDNTITVVSLTPGGYHLVLKEHGVIIGMKKFVRM